MRAIIKSKQSVLPIAMSVACIPSTPESYLAQPSESENNIVYAKPENLTTDFPLAKVVEISEFFHDRANKVKVQFLKEHARCAWVDMSKFCPNAQVKRRLEYAIDPSIEKIRLSEREGRVAHG